MKRLTLVGLLALAVAMLLALPGSALAKGGHGGSHANRGNHCGQGHAKHTGKVGKSCQKLTRNGAGKSQGNPANDPQGGNDDQDQAGDDQDEAGNDDQDQAGDDQGEAGDDDQGDVDDDQGDDDGGSGDD